MRITRLRLIHRTPLPPAPPSSDADVNNVSNTESESDAYGTHPAPAPAVIVTAPVPTVAAPVPALTASDSLASSIFSPVAAISVIVPDPMATAASLTDMVVVPTPTSTIPDSLLAAAAAQEPEEDETEPETSFYGSIDLTRTETDRLFDELDALHAAQQAASQADQANHTANSSVGVDSEDAMDLGGSSIISQGNAGPPAYQSS